MQLPNCEEIILKLEEGVLYLTLNRPQKRNAMNDKLVAEVMQTFDAIESSREVRAVVMRGTGGHFCAGGDISGMNDSSRTPDDAKRAAWEFNRTFGRMITKVNRAPQLVITLLEGAVLGGGFGLACISDVAIADTNAKLAMPETGLGLPPAQIAPFVVMRIGITQTRRLALLGERIGGEEAVRLGLVHYVTDGEQAMDEKLQSVLTKLRRCAPNATAMTKQLILDVGSTELEALLDRASNDFSAALNSAEGKDGTQAFIEKRRPFWAQ
jgi:isohexenylglutaconyl-CoA hydratase